MYSKIKSSLAVLGLAGVALSQNPQNYNVFVHDNFACSNSDVEGRLAAGGSITVNNYAVGCKTYLDPSSTSTCIQFGSVHCADHANDDPAVFAGTSLNFNNGQVYAGSVVYGTTMTSNSLQTVLDCPVSQLSGAQALVQGQFAGLSATSQQFAAQAANGNVTNAYGTFTFTATTDEAYFTVSASALATANTLVMNAPSTATRLIINVSGTSVTMQNFGTNFSNYPHKIMFNFYEATTLSISGANIFATILAPGADYSSSNGVVNGQILVKSISTPNMCAQFNHAPFNWPPPPSGVCGNGQVDVGEQCDGGVCCQADCTFVSSSSNTVCRPSAGECDVAETCSGSAATCPDDSFLPTTTPCGSQFGICDVQLKTHCPGNGPTCNRAPPAYLFYWDAFNVVSFDQYTCHGGDVEGRLAVKNHLDVSGFTVGLQTVATDAVSYYELVVSGDAEYDDGSVNVGPNNRQGAIAVGGNFNAPAYLQALRDANAYVPASLFNDAQTYFSNISTILSNLPVNAKAAPVYTTGLLLTCDSLQDLYHVKIPAGLFKTTTWYLTSGCKFSAAWILDVTGTDTVELNGAPFSGVVERVIYNVAGSNTITANNGVAGNILAPNSNYIQSQGVTYGKVIVGNVTEARQNNKPNCIDFRNVQITNKVVKPVQLSDDFVYLVDIRGYAVGDQICIQGNCRKVQDGQIGDIDGDGTIDNVVYVDAPFATAASVMTDAVTMVDANAERQSIPITEQNDPIHSGASYMTSISAALLGLVAYFF
eukprot:TRINITY_DN8_c0_g1_i1.p1 TRINITY_DN8_c0_g1~~TRINITY_DN8_c0_g1_i1.p1  ORF type:complete len:764 (-),score=216.99 TRINITY_DN8_c0_g1_i1:131-2422(-)